MTWGRLYEAQISHYLLTIKCPPYIVLTASTDPLDRTYSIQASDKLLGLRKTGPSFCLRCCIWVDYRCLAVHFDMSIDEIHMISRTPNLTDYLLKCLEQNPENTIAKLREVQYW